MQDFRYASELNGITDQWHKIVLPDGLFGKVSHDLSDIRIFGVTAENDTIEAPYLLKRAQEKVSVTEINFRTINTAYNEGGFYFTFEIPTAAVINQIQLDFEQRNFDWKVKLEGSQNQTEWFTIVEDYRILSIQNSSTDYRFTKINIPDSSYPFFRLSIDSEEKPALKTASFFRQDITAGTYRTYLHQHINTIEKRQAKQTEIEVELAEAVPVSHIKINVRDTLDFHRAVSVRYLSDSTQTERGWKYHYALLGGGTLNSLEENELRLDGKTIVKKLKILIHNQDNQPLNIDEIILKGPVHELVARFTSPATYYLVYGNERAGKPVYDIARFESKIPESMTALILGKERELHKEALSEASPLFSNKIWLWITMIAIILLLGWFSLRMMGN